MNHRLFVLTLSFLSCLAFVAPPARAAAIDTPFIKGTGPDVFYYNGETKYQFPDWETYRSWANDASGLDAGLRIMPFDDASVSAIPFGGYVTYRPGRAIKTASDPKVYIVTAPRTLRLIPNEDMANAIFKTTHWATAVATIHDARISDYVIAQPIERAADVATVMLQPWYFSIRQSVPTPSIEKFPHPEVSAVNDAGLHRYIIHTPLSTAATLAWVRMQSAGWTTLYDGSLSDSSSLRHLYPDAYAGQKSVDMYAITYGKSNGSTFMHRTILIPKTFTDVQNETILSFFEVEYPKGYIVFPRAVTTQFEGAVPTFGQQLVTQSSVDAVVRWYMERPSGYGWKVVNTQIDSYEFQGKTSTSVMINLQRADSPWRMDVYIYGNGGGGSISIYTR